MLASIGPSTRLRLGSFLAENIRANLRILMQLVQTSDRWSWLQVQIDGDDLVVRGTRATNFGMPSDKLDNGVGCSGFPVARHPELALVALPFRVKGHTQFHDSPIPPLLAKSPKRPGQRVRVYCPATGKSVEAELADLGPSLVYKGRKLYKGIDLSEGAVKALGLSLGAGVYTVDYRIIGGALLLSEDMKP